jgi:hypothetical protein
MGLFRSFFRGGGYSLRSTPLLRSFCGADYTFNTGRRWFSPRSSYSFSSSLLFPGRLGHLIYRIGASTTPRALLFAGSPYYGRSRSRSSSLPLPIKPPKHEFGSGYNTKGDPKTRLNDYRSRLENGESLPNIQKLMSDALDKDATQAEKDAWGQNENATRGIAHLLAQRTRDENFMKKCGRFADRYTTLTTTKEKLAFLFDPAYVDLKSIELVVNNDIRRSFPLADQAYTSNNRVGYITELAKGIDSLGFAGDLDQAILDAIKASKGKYTTGGSFVTTEQLIAKQGYRKEAADAILASLKKSEISDWEAERLAQHTLPNASTLTSYSTLINARETLATTLDAYKEDGLKKHEKKQYEQQYSMAAKRYNRAISQFNAELNEHMSKHIEDLYKGVEPPKIEFKAFSEKETDIKKAVEAAKEAAAGDPSA